MTDDSNKLPDFTGWASKNDLLCSDGRTIREGAFAHQDGMKVPLVWHHDARNPENVLGHVYLEHREGGVYSRAFFNDSDTGQVAKQLVEHGDVDKLSIRANNLVHRGSDVTRGQILEVSLVLQGANPGATIDNVNIMHSDGSFTPVEDEAIITVDEEITLIHGDEDILAEVEDGLPPLVTDDSKQEETPEPETPADETPEDEIQHDDSSDEPPSPTAEEEETVQDILDTLSEKQKQAVEFATGVAVLAAQDETNNPEEELQQGALDFNQEGHTDAMNVFDRNAQAPKGPTLNHSQISSIFEAAKKPNSTLKEAFLSLAPTYLPELAHDGVAGEDYGIANLDYLFPDARLVGDMPELIARQAEWVPKVLGATKHAPFSKIKSVTADLTAPEARARGYVKGTKKQDEVIELLKRTTGPATIYKKQRLDRDDILDITDFDVVVWLKWEIRFMLNEEIARAILVGDGRASNNPDKVKDPAGSNDGVGIRSIYRDDDMYSHKLELAANVSSEVLIEEITRARVAYRGSGSPTLYTTDEVLVDLLLLKDKMGRRLYDTDAALAAALRVKEIVAVEVMNEYPSLLGIIVNLTDYTIGSNKGGELSFFDDFDLDFNQFIYLMETRISGALTKPKSAIVITREQGTSATPGAPSFNGTTNTITIPGTVGVQYLIDGDEVAAGNHVITADAEVTAEAKSGYYLAPNTTRTWSYQYTD